MMIREISPVSQSRYRVVLESGQDFVLYKGEINRYRFKEGQELSADIYMEIVEQILTPRAKKRAMNLLERGDRTEKELTEKLVKDGYPENCVAEAIAYVQRYGYLNDDRYIENFIRGKGSKKSRKELEFLLFQKGFSRERISKSLDYMNSEVSDRTAIESLMRRKRFDPDSADEQKKQKMIQYLMRKGFQYRDIRQVIQISTEDA